MLTRDCIYLTVGVTVQLCTERLMAHNTCLPIHYALLSPLRTVYVRASSLLIDFLMYFLSFIKMVKNLGKY